ncbi:hypothetical protein [Neptunicella marina]|uniref:Uncharacterized protein n=1 Tax=Neptunicella marina TaxID=2125989 RepID=A0A8J6M2V1_9ALTE|nr:hypothetical protein [Neptunicella marina]MBC3766763.1 hypothetical protein [Neptunicella marina]
MQPTKLIKLIRTISMVTLFAGISGSAMANTQQYDVKFKTVPDVGLTPLTAIDFGSGMKLNSGSVCTMQVANATGAFYPGNSRLKIASGAADAEGATYGELAGTGCSYTTLTGTPGVYQITGVPGSTVKITLQSVSGTSFDFAPAGCASNYDGSSDGDSCTALLTDTQASVVLATSGDTVGNSAGSGTITSGSSIIVVGGDVTSNINFTTSQLYTETYTIDVTY